MIEIEQLCKSYNKVIIDNFSYIFEDNKTYCLFGPSGSGKTTLIRLIMGFEQADKGKIKIKNGSRLSVVFQEDRLLPWLSAKRNILAVNKDKTVCDNLLKAFHLEKEENKYPSELSGGMQRRIALARALAYDGDIFFMDEPFKGLDYKLKKEIIYFMNKKIEKKLCIFITHDIEEAELLSDVILNIDGSPLFIKKEIKILKK